MYTQNASVFGLIVFMIYVAAFVMVFTVLVTTVLENKAHIFSDFRTYSVGTHPVNILLNTDFLL